MTTKSVLFSFVATMAMIAAVLSQSTLPQGTTKPAEEAYVIEQMSTQVTFDEEGNRTRQQNTRVRVSSDAGVQEWGLLSFPYQSAVETVELGYVRVRKPDNSVILTPDENAQDLDSEITRTAPFYSDLREKHVAVKGLAKGDLIEYQVNWRPKKPLVQGQFWFEYNFHHRGIVLAEDVSIRVPADRKIKFKGPQSTQTIKTEGEWRIYRWGYSKPERSKEAETEKNKIDALRGRSPAPDVQLSSFQSWEDVGRWYWSLQKGRVEPSAAVRAKAAEITKGMTDDGAKLRAIYSFVSTQYRYIGISFGIGRYQPHSADDVLGNNYGDCKDKHTLLAALFKASGINLYPALISVAHTLDPDVPSPGQFDHIIGYLPQGKGAIWLDTTPEVAPFGYLLGPLREKPALVMQEERAELITTPADVPFPTVQNFRIEGKLKDDGSFEAQVQDTMRGDNEVLLRSSFRRTPQAQWKELMQQISYGLGYSGTVSDVSASSPEHIAEPFHFSYTYNRKDYPDWTNHQFTVPGLPFYMPVARDDSKDPIWLGVSLETVSDAKVEVPKGYKPVLPSDVNLVYDFAEYHAAYGQDQGVLTCQRRLIVKMHEVPAAELDDYRSFVKNLQNDVYRYVQTQSNAMTSAGRTAPPAAIMTFNSTIAAIKSLPNSASAEANRLEADAISAAQRNDLDTAEKSFKQALETDPKFTRVWGELATIYLSRRQNDAALDALRKGIDSDRKAVAVQKLYAYFLTFLHREEAASQAWRNVLELAPDDLDANRTLALLFMQGKHYADALPLLETVARLDSSPTAQIQLGSAYLKAGQSDKGSDTLLKAVQNASDPVVFNDVGYELADASVNLPQALDYAQRAVELQEKQSHDLRLSSLLVDDLDCTMKIGSFWDTLGWVEFRSGHLDRAERYLQSAWTLTQVAISADHLGQLYEKEMKTEQAIHMYRLAMATTEGRSEVGDDPQKHLQHLGVKITSNFGLPVRARGPNPEPNPGAELSNMRTVKLKRLMTSKATAEFFLLFNSSSKVEEAKFVSGSEQLRFATEELRNVDFHVSFPPGSSARIVRRGILMCSQISGCDIVLYTPGSVHSLQ